MNYQNCEYLITESHEEPICKITGIACQHYSDNDECEVFQEEMYSYN